MCMSMVIPLTKLRDNICDLFNLKDFIKEIISTQTMKLLISAFPSILPLPQPHPLISPLTHNDVISPACTRASEHNKQGAIFWSSLTPVKISTAQQ